MTVNSLQQLGNIVTEPGFQELIRRASAARAVSHKGYREDVPGIFFRSRWEANYARYLNHLVTVGEITSWKHEPTTFWFEKIRRGVRSYKPDFEVISGDRLYYVEVKGWMDPKSRTKLKRMRIYHPKIELLVVDEKAYSVLERTIGPSIPFWEFPEPRKKKAKTPVPEQPQSASPSNLGDSQPAKPVKRSRARKGVDSGVA